MGNKDLRGKVFKTKFLTPKSLTLHVVDKSAIVLGGKVKTLYIKELAQDSTFDSHQMEVDRIVVTCDVANIKDATFQATGDVIFLGNIARGSVINIRTKGDVFFKKAIMGRSVVDIDTPGRIQGDGGIRDFSTVRFRSRATGVQFREVTRGAELVSE